MTLYRNTNQGNRLNGAYPNGDEPASSGFTLPTMPMGTGTTYYVSKSGNDSNDGSEGSPWLTLNGLNGNLVAGDTVLIGEGTYQEQGTAGFMSIGTAQGDIARSTWNITVSGTEGQPITFMANPANTGPVIIDGNHVFGGNASFNGGIFIGYNKYLNFKNLVIQNCMGKGIYNYDHTGDVVQEAQVASDIWIEGCDISGISGTDNDSGIGIWSGRRVTLINNTIYDIIGWPAQGRGGWGVLSYGFEDSLIRNNRIYNASASMGGIFLKDHYLASESPRTPSVECEIAYNLITTNGTCMAVGPQGSNTVEAGINNIHHNIFHSSNARVGINYPMAAVQNPTIGKQTIKHNLVIGNGLTDSSAFYFEATEDIELEGNIAFGFNRMIESAYVNTTDNPFVITASDRNVFDSSSSLALLNRYPVEGSTESYATLSAWQAATSASPYIAVDNPDSNSVTATLAATITDAANGDYTLVSGTSPAIGLMSDGSDSGPYQNGNEVIGVVS